jgi:hypothetical protein
MPTARTQVTTVNDNVVEVRKVHISRDLGITLKLDRGLRGGRTVILFPSADLANGQRVNVRNSNPEGDATTASR